MERQVMMSQEIMSQGGMLGGGRIVYISKGAKSITIPPVDNSCKNKAFRSISISPVTPGVGLRVSDSIDTIKFMEDGGVQIIFKQPLKQDVRVVLQKYPEVFSDESETK